MTKNRNVLAALASAAVAAGLTCAQPTASASPSTCADLGGTVDASQVCQVHSETESYTMDISLPLDYPDQQAVFDYLVGDRDDFLKWMTEIGPQQPRNRPYVHQVTAKTFRSGTPTAGTQSLLLEIDDDTGAAHEGHPNTWYQAFNYDMDRHAPITFDALFKPGTNPLDVLNPIVQEQLDVAPGALDASAYRNFAVTDDAVIFYFGEDQFGPDNRGPHQISVPRPQLASLLA